MERLFYSGRPWISCHLRRDLTPGLSRAYGEEPSGRFCVWSTSCPNLLPCFYAMYCSSVFFTIFSESARFAFQVHCRSCQAWQTVLILVCTLLADQFYVEFKWRSDFKSDSNPCCPGGIVNRHSGPGRQILKYCKHFLMSLPVILHSFPQAPRSPRSKST